jgi:hypothetical protein
MMLRREPGRMKCAIGPRKEFGVKVRRTMEFRRVHSFNVATTEPRKEFGVNVALHD